MEHLQYPVGKHQYNAKTAKENKADFLATIASYPSDIARMANELGAIRLDTPYRPGGWTARQVIHHVADSHMHAFLRFKLALTEDKPVIKPYDEGPTAMLSDYSMSVDYSITILQGVHARWSNLLNHMTDNDFDRIYVHPQYGQEFTLWEALSLYDWHCRHHLGHLALLKLEG
jgi:hypothetical protein